MPIYHVRASRTEIHLIDAYVRADTASEAEADFYAGPDSGADVISWMDSYDSSETEVDTIERLSRVHDIHPMGLEGGAACGACGGRVIRAEEGDWFHAGESLPGLGVGL